MGRLSRPRVDPLSGWLRPGQCYCAGTRFARALPLICGPGNSSPSKLTKIGMVGFIPTMGVLGNADTSSSPTQALIAPGLLADSPAPVGRATHAAVRFDGAVEPAAADSKTGERRREGEAWDAPLPRLFLVSGGDRLAADLPCWPTG